MPIRELESARSSARRSAVSSAKTDGAARPDAAAGVIAISGASMSKMPGRSRSAEPTPPRPAATPAPVRTDSISASKRAGVSAPSRTAERSSAAATKSLRAAIANGSAMRRRIDVNATIGERCVAASAIAGSCTMPANRCACAASRAGSSAARVIGDKAASSARRAVASMPASARRASASISRQVTAISNSMRSCRCGAARSRSHHAATIPSRTPRGSVAGRNDWKLAITSTYGLPAIGTSSASRSGRA